MRDYFYFQLVIVVGVATLIILFQIGKITETGNRNDTKCTLKEDFLLNTPQDIFSKEIEQVGRQLLADSYDSRKLCLLNGFKVRDKKVTIYDGFIMNDELELLEIRLNELYRIVDYFVVVESNIGFRGTTKPKYFLENITDTRWNLVRDKIISVHCPLENFGVFTEQEIFSLPEIHNKSSTVYQTG